jgi:hypothetical protein
VVAVELALVLAVGAGFAVAVDVETDFASSGGAGLEMELEPAPGLVWALPLGDVGASVAACGGLAGGGVGCGAVAEASSRAANGWESVADAGGVDNCVHSADPIAGAALISDAILGTVEPLPAS